MADFCRQCTTEAGLPGTLPAGDFFPVKLTPEEARAGYGIPVICEGCGPTRVDHEGYCLSRDCLDPHRFYPEHAAP
jgi:hypothetical protein